MQSEFTANSKLKPSILYRKKIYDTRNRSFAVENRSGAVRSFKSFQNISPKNAISGDSLNSLVQKVTELQKHFTDIEQKQFINEKRKLYGYINFPSISHSKISVTLTDEGLVKFYYFVSQYDACFLTQLVHLSLPCHGSEMKKMKRR